MSLNKYKKIDPECEECKGEGNYSRKHGGNAYYTSYDTIRCKCSYIKTKKYSEFIDNNAWIKTSSAMGGY